MAVKRVDVPDLGTVHLYKRRSVRGLRLSVGHGGEIRVSLPTWVPYRAAIEFAGTHRQWIKSQQFDTTLIAQGDRIGKAHHIQFIPEPARITIITRITKTGEVRIYTPADTLVSDRSVQQAAHKASIRALKQQGEKLLPQRLRTLADTHGFTYGTVTVKQLKSRWGSCSDKHDIALNCFLMQLPWQLIDYVLLHELVHTRIMAHGPRFWEELGQYVPDLKAVRKEIKAHRPVLLPQ